MIVKVTTLGPEGVRDGIYRYNGDLYVVKPNKQHTRSYASLIDYSNGYDSRGLKLQYVEGMMRVLSGEDRVRDFSEFSDYESRLLQAVGRCVYCGRSLRTIRSLKTLIGPVCRKSMGLA